jgi:site-specific recombinase XerD
MQRPPVKLLEDRLRSQIENLKLSLRPSTVKNYDSAVKSFLRFLGVHYPDVGTPSALRRDPHILGWLHYLCEKDPPLSKASRLAHIICLRRLLIDLADSGRCTLPPGLFQLSDFPRLDHFLPKPLSPEDDRLLVECLRRRNDLTSNILLLLRATGIRIGECLRLAADCLKHLGQQDWALYVPLGKLHTERWVPVDQDVRNLVERILVLRDQTRRTPSGSSLGFLIPQPRGHQSAYQRITRVLKASAREAGCSTPVSLHRLRHTYATDMLRAGVSLPALQQLLGHKCIHMTLRYLQVTQNDLQREYHQARRSSATRHQMPDLAVPGDLHDTTLPGIPGIAAALAATRHLLEMYRRQITNQPTSLHLERLANRLAKIAAQLEHLPVAPT